MQEDTLHKGTEIRPAANLMHNIAKMGGVNPSQQYCPKFNTILKEP